MANKPEIKPLEEFGRTKDEQLLRLLHEIYCRITNIEYFSYRASIENFGNINYIEVKDVGTEPVELVIDIAADRIIRVYNITYDSPDILFVTPSATMYGVPINAGESASFVIRENKKLYGRFASGTGKVVVAHMTV